MDNAIKMLLMTVIAGSMGAVEGAYVKILLNLLKRPEEERTASWVLSKSICIVSIIVFLPFLIGYAISSVLAAILTVGFLLIGFHVLGPWFLEKMYSR